MSSVKKGCRILFLEASAGGGHLSITTAVVQELSRRYPNAEIIREDILPSFVQKFYKVVSRQFVDAYSLFYKATDNQKGNELLLKMDRAIYRKKITKLILEKKPDLIFSNVYFAANEVPAVLQKLSLQIPFVMFVSDPFSPFSSFFSPKADLTLVSTFRTYQMALNYGVLPERVAITGHPIREEFFQRPKDLAAHRKSLGLDPDAFTILFGGSGHGSERTLELLIHMGMAPNSRLLKKILQLTTLEYKAFYRLISQESNRLERDIPHFQILCVTGDNVDLKENISQLKFPKNVSAHIFGKVSDMSSLIHAADLVVGKAGPNILFESIAGLKPFFATYHIKGQENENIDFIKYAQLGFVEEDPQKAAGLIKAILKNPGILEPLFPFLSFVRSQHEHAAERIVDLLGKYIG